MWLRSRSTSAVLADGALWQGLPHGTVMGHVHLHVGRLERGEALYHASLGLDQMA